MTMNHSTNVVTRLLVAGTVAACAARSAQAATLPRPRADVAFGNVGQVRLTVTTGQVSSMSASATRSQLLVGRIDDGVVIAARAKVGGAIREHRLGTEAEHVSSVSLATTADSGLAAWAERAPDEVRVVAQRLDESGVPLGSTWVLATIDAHRAGIGVEVTTGSNARGLVVVHDRGGDDGLLFHDLSGRGAEPSLLVEAESPRWLRVVGVGSGHVVAWLDGRGGPNLRAAFVSGGKVQWNELLTHGGDTGAFALLRDGADVVVAFDQRLPAKVGVWQYDENIGVLDVGTHAFRAWPVALSDATEFSPAIAKSPRGGYLLAHGTWQDGVVGLAVKEVTETDVTEVLRFDLPQAREVTAIHLVPTATGHELVWVDDDLTPFSNGRDVWSLSVEDGLR